MKRADFENLAAALLFPHGNRVVVKTTRKHTDNIKIWLTPRSSPVLVQCKYWQLLSVDAEMVMELQTLMHDHKARIVNIVTCGIFTLDAIEYARRAKNIVLIDGSRLLALFS
jgi:restriction endonuclease Mrr